MRLLSAVTVLALLCGLEAVRASDIPGEIEPPPCNFGPDGSLLNGPPACTGPMHISLDSGTGSLSTNTSPLGSFDSPWTLTQQLSSQNAVLRFAGGFGPALPFSSDLENPGDPTDSGYLFARVFSLTLTNNTTSSWTSVYLELQTTIGQPSTEDDGLSFGKLSRNPPQLALKPSSNIFSSTTLGVTSNDSITFSGGTLLPNSSATFQFMISDNGPNDPFFLIEQPTVAGTPEPAAFALAGIGALFVLLVATRRRPYFSASFSSRR